MSWVPLPPSLWYDRSAFPLTCSKAMSNRAWASVGAVDHTCPMLFVTLQVGVHTYASSQPSSPSVTMIRMSPALGDKAIRPARSGRRVVGRPDSASHAVALLVRVFSMPPLLLPF